LGGGELFEKIKLFNTFTENMAAEIVLLIDEVNIIGHHLLPLQEHRASRPEARERNFLEQRQRQFSENH
jgi:hypothetical protein